MKFFVACFGGLPPPVVPEEAPRPEEPRHLEHRKRCRKEKTSSSSSSADWHPSLCAISEDNVILEKEERPAAESVKKKTPRRKAAPSAKVHVRSYSGDYGRSQISMIPTFSPAPFMF